MLSKFLFLGLILLGQTSVGSESKPGAAAPCRRLFIDPAKINPYGEMYGWYFKLLRHNCLEPLDAMIDIRLQVTVKERRVYPYAKQVLTKILSLTDAGNNSAGKPSYKANIFESDRNSKIEGRSCGGSHLRLEKQEPLPVFGCHKEQLLLDIYGNPRLRTGVFFYSTAQFHPSDVAPMPDVDEVDMYFKLTETVATNFMCEGPVCRTVTCKLQARDIASASPSEGPLSCNFNLFGKTKITHKCVLTGSRFMSPVLLTPMYSHGNTASVYKTKVKSDQWSKHVGEEPLEVVTPKWRRLLCCGRK